MLWILVLGLLAWSIILTGRISSLKERAQQLELRLQELLARFEAGAPIDATKPVAPPAPAREPERAVPTRPIQMAQPVPILEEAVAPEAFVAARPPPREPAGPPPREVIRAWLEENGLAWAGGAALALGGLFLVTYAAQRGMFTPPLRIAAAVITGSVLLVASEWLKRRAGHPLAAAMAAGAGAATLYGAAWAASSRRRSPDRTSGPRRR